MVAQAASPKNQRRSRLLPLFVFAAALVLSVSAPGALGAQRPAGFVSVIIRSSTNLHAAARTVAASGGQVGQQLAIIHGFVARFPPAPGYPCVDKSCRRRNWFP